MSDYAILQRDVFIEASKDSPATYLNMGRYENITFYSGGAITEVDGSQDGVTFKNITSLCDTSVSGLAIIKGKSFKAYRVTSAGNKISVSAN